MATGGAAIWWLKAPRRRLRVGGGCLRFGETCGIRIEKAFIPDESQLMFGLAGI